MGNTINNNDLTGIVIHVPKVRHRTALLALLYAAGYVGRSTRSGTRMELLEGQDADGNEQNAVRIDYNNGLLGISALSEYKKKSEYPRLTTFMKFPADLKKIDKWLDDHPGKPLSIEEHNVFFLPGCMHVGCVVIDQGMFDDICKRWMPAVAQ